MKKLSFILVSVCLLGSWKVEGQRYQVYFPGQDGTASPSQSLNPQHSFSDVQNPYSPRQQRQDDSFSPGSNEVLGNFFNGQVPQQTQGQLGPQVQHRLVNPFASQISQGPSQLPYTSSYLAPPVSTSIPRQTHFFGNNYDFFKQFHQPQVNYQQTGQQQQQQGHNVRNPLSGNHFQPQQQNLFQSPTPSSHFNTFGTSAGTTTSFRPSSAPLTTPQSFTTSQYLNTGQNNAFTYAIESNSGSPPPPAINQQIQQTRDSGTVSYSQPQSSSPSFSPSLPRHQSQPTSKSQSIPVLNSLYNGYEEAAKVLGVPHGLRVITTKTLTAYPTVSIAPASEVTEKAKAVELSNPSTTTSTTTASTKTTTTIRTTTPTATTTTIRTTTPTATTTIEPISSSPESTYFVSSTPEEQRHYFSSTQSPPEDQTYYVSSSPAPTFQTIIRSTGRSIHRLPPVSNSPIVLIPTPPQQPSIIVANSRQREPLFRHSNRVVASNYVESPYSLQKEEQLITRPPVTLTTLKPRPTPSPVSGRAVGQTRHRQQPPTKEKQLQSHQTPGQGQTLGPYYYNNLMPMIGSLYTNTNGAYQSYYSGVEGQHLGLEEIEPQIIDLNVSINPNKLIPLRPENEAQDNQDFQSPFGQFDHFGVTEEPRRPHQPPVIISTLGTSTLPPAVESTQKTINGEVYRVGPKGRLLKKRKRVQRPIAPEPPQAPRLIPQGPSPIVIPQNSPIPFFAEPSLPSYVVRQSFQNQSPIDEPYQPTTYRPNLNALQNSETNINMESNKEENPIQTTTYRSKFRYSPISSGAVRSTTQNSGSVASPSAPTLSIGSTDEEKTKIIESRLKSLERQIRFRNKNPKNNS